jgi:hypothetical protein
MASWGTRLRHLDEEWLTGRPYPRWRRRGGGANRRPAGEAAEEGGQPVRELVGVCTVLGEVPVGAGNGQSDASTWMALAMLSTTVCT